MKLSALWSHTTYVCPGFECNARMGQVLSRDTLRCVNGHEWTSQQIIAGELGRPWRGSL